MTILEESTIKEKYNAKVICSGHGNSNTPGADKKIFNNQIFMFGKIQFKIIHVPGHTIDHICFFFQKSQKQYLLVTHFFLWDVAEYLKVQ